MPVSTRAPPTSWMRPGCWPSRTNAKTTAKITSVSATNDAMELPSRRTAMMPVR